MKPHQSAQLAAIVTRHCTFYYRLVKRMERLSFLPTDPVYQRAIRARDAVDALRVFIEDIGANAPAAPTTTGYLNDPDTPPGRRRARVT